MEMEFLTALLSIIVIDLVLAGDNAILIGLAARNLPKHQQKKVILWGSIGAIAIRIVATLAVVWLLAIPGLHLVGGLLLVFIAYKLLVDDNDHGDVKAGDSFWAAIRTVIIADALMGLDNVLAVAGASHGNMLLVVIGLLISVPVVMWGSTLILKWIDRYPIIVTIGAGVLAWTASKMIVGEHFLSGLFENGFVKYGFEVLVVAAVILTAKYVKSKSVKLEDEQEVLLKTGSN
ncbi:MULTISPECIES: TerC family protein [Metabacillus]|uniref:TerC family protein n=1 Tax=Metabacillus TaxID=2675233 RepID=UPI001BA056AF|nr:MULTISPECIES: TerC family protein [Metabacillus]MCM3161052.1 TerC family protein [Metabacillus litoralis]UGB29994.1 TerC family protein [Metabacillus sp. B2-18]UHA62059.1 TerC family protein [Metabacillus litoralis]